MQSKKYIPDPQATRTGIVFGCAMCSIDKEMSRDAELLQRALLGKPQVRSRSVFGCLPSRLRKLLT